MKRILTATVLIGLALGFGLKVLEDNLPQLFKTQYTPVFKLGAMNFGPSDLAQAALWGILAFTLGPLGLAALAGLAIHQLLWYFAGLSRFKLFGISL